MLYCESDHQKQDKAVSSGATSSKTVFLGLQTFLGFFVFI